MSQAVLYVNESGRAALNAAAIMENAIELVFSTIDPDDVDSATIPERIESAHVSLLGIAAKLLANGMTGTALAPASRTAPVAVETEVVASTPVAVAAPVLARPTAQILELPLQRPAQPRKKAQAKRVEAKPAPQAKAPAVTAPVQEALPFEIPAPAKAKTVKGRAKITAKAPLKRRRSDKAKKAKFPGRLSRIEDAVKMDVVVCLEDGKRVTDLGKHLETLGMTPEQYRRKWKLSGSYPMMAPSVVVKRGAEYEYDPIHKRMVKTN
jgi:predicted transcriptional regulator